MRYFITIKGRRYRFETIEAASAKASAIFTATGIVVGIERE